MADPARARPGRDRSGGRIGQAEIDGLREISRTYRQLDNRLVGGQLRATAVQLLDRQVAPLLLGAGGGSGFPQCDSG